MSISPNVNIVRSSLNPEAKTLPALSYAAAVTSSPVAASNTSPGSKKKVHTFAAAAKCKPASANVGQSQIPAIAKVVLQQPKGTSPSPRHFNPSADDIVKLQNGQIPSGLLKAQISRTVGAYRSKFSLKGQKPLSTIQFQYCKDVAKNNIRAMFVRFSCGIAADRANLAAQKAIKMIRSHTKATKAIPEPAVPSVKVETRIQEVIPEHITAELHQLRAAVRSHAAVVSQLNTQMSLTSKLTSELHEMKSKFEDELKTLRAELTKPKPAASTTIIPKDWFKTVEWDAGRPFGQLPLTTVDSYPSGKIEYRPSATYADLVAVPLTGAEFVLLRLNKKHVVTASGSIDSKIRLWALVFLQEYFGPPLKGLWEGVKRTDKGSEEFF